MFKTSSLQIRQLHSINVSQICSADPADSAFWHILPFWNMCALDQKKLQSASRIDGADQLSVAQLYDQLIHLF